MDTVEDFLKARGSHDAFYWSPPRAQSSGDDGLYTAVQWTRTYIGPDSDQIDVTFKRELDD
mgnify:CR=1 FL=1